MTPAARLQATLELLQTIDETPRPADTLAGAYFRARRYMGSKDRAAVNTRLYAILRHHARLGWWLAKQGMAPEPRLRVLAWLVLGEHTPLRHITELCSGGKFGAPVLSDAETAFLRKIEGGTIDRHDMPENVLAECPEESAEALHKKFGKHFLQEMKAMQEPAPLDLRVNTIKTTREDMIPALQKLGLKAEACKLSPWGIRVYERPSLAGIAALKNGLIDIQDEGSQLIAKITDAQPGERVVDFCAGAGGKTLALGAMMQNKGRITACDVMERRLKNSSERFKRAGLHNIEIRPLANERDPWVKKHKGTFDRVLVDAPCSGSGTWRRNPDARWRQLGPDLETLVKLQAEILDSAARLVRPGGRLIYATCSLYTDENEKQIDKFLAAHPDFSAVPCGLDNALYLSLTPARHGTDGFFGAVMMRQAKTDEGSTKAKPKAAATEA